MDAYSLVKALKETVKIPIQVHSHFTAGIADMVLLKAIEAGADVVDTALSPLAMGTSHPATESIVAALKGTEYDTGLDLVKLSEVSKHFKTLRKKYMDSGLLNPKNLGVNIKTLLYQVPGGMLSNLFSQLKQQNALDRLNQVLEEIPRVREDLGYPPLVTPMSQMVGVQATQNVLLGERYKSIGKEVKAYLHGEYGRAPGKVNPELVKKALGDEKPIECRFADTLKPSFEKTKKELSGTAKSDEDVLSYIAFPQVAEKFFEERRKKEENVVSYTIEAVTE